MIIIKNLQINQMSALNDPLNTIKQIKQNKINSTYINEILIIFKPFYNWYFKFFLLTNDVFK